VNPVYHANVVGKAIWLGEPYSLWAMVYVAVMAVVSAVCAGSLFRRVCERTGIQG